MKRSIAIATLCAGLSIVAVGCEGGGSDEATASPTQATGSKRAQTTEGSARAEAAKRVSLGLRQTRYGRILVDGRGHTLYLFTRESTKRSRCYGACAKAWPPFYAPAGVLVRSGLSKRRLGTTRRTGGRRQVTYNGHPLYFYEGETQAGQVLCQDVAEFGGTWLVVSSKGRAIR